MSKRAGPTRDDWQAPTQQQGSGRLEGHDLPGYIQATASVLRLLTVASFVLDSSRWSTEGAELVGASLLEMFTWNRLLIPHANRRERERFPLRLLASVLGSGLSVGARRHSVHPRKVNGDCRATQGRRPRVMICGKPPSSLTAFDQDSRSGSGRISSSVGQDRVCKMVPSRGQVRDTATIARSTSARPRRRGARSSGQKKKKKRQAQGIGPK